jgi:uncharacterized lipoprotein NlpE involved in copper resistance
MNPHRLKHLMGLMALGGLLLATACKPKKSNPPATTPPAQSEPAEPAAEAAPAGIPDGHNSRISLDWDGTYTGVVPCADCEGIRTSLTLFESGSYTLSQEYLGKGDQPFSENGAFEWDEAGAVITLAPGSDSPRYYQVGENVLIQLDQEGKRITGKLSDRYRLAKNRTDPRMEDKKWVLVELMGQPVETTEGQRTPFIKFNSALGQFTGNNGCNAMVGGYLLKEGYRLETRQTASTLMACPNEQTANQFLEVLQRADNYTVSEEEMSLNKAKMAPLARFRLAE